MHSRGWLGRGGWNLLLSKLIHRFCRAAGSAAAGLLHEVRGVGLAAEPAALQVRTSSGAWIAIILLGVHPVMGAESPGSATLGFDLVRSTDYRHSKDAVDGASVTVALIESGGQPTAGLPVFAGKNFTPISGGGPIPHAVAVASIFFGKSPEYEGVAPGVKEIVVGDPLVFLKQYVQELKPIDARIINQSFSMPKHIPQVDAALDRYADECNVLFVNGGHGETNTVSFSPSTMYNAICVGGCDPKTGASTLARGPFQERAKPDLLAPTSGGFYFLGPPPCITNSVVGLIGTSMSAPFVSGAAALLMDYALARAETRPGADPRVVKAILMSSARKGASWKASVESPLDPEEGAGVLDVNGAMMIMARGAAPSTRLSAGWALQGIQSGAVRTEEVEITQPVGNLTVTLVWNCHVMADRAEMAILELRLLDRNGKVVAESLSRHDNLQHLHAKGLTKGAYTIEVRSRGRNKEICGLAWRTE